MPIIAAIPDEERQRMRKEAQQTRDKNHSRRLIAILMHDRHRRRQTALGRSFIRWKMDKLVYFTWC